MLNVLHIYSPPTFKISTIIYLHFIYEGMKMYGDACCY